MVYLKKFNEAFKSKDISAIDNFLKKLDKYDSVTFKKSLEGLSEYFDSPLSEFSGKYMSAKLAFKYNNPDEINVKYFLSIKHGLLGITTNTLEFGEYKGSKSDYLGGISINFAGDKSKELENFCFNNYSINLYYSSVGTIRLDKWDKEMSGNIKDLIDADYALVLTIPDTKNLDKIKKQRIERKSGRIIKDDDYNRQTNLKRYSEILKDRRRPESLKKFFYGLLEYSLKNDTNPADDLYRFYKDGYITKEEYLELQSTLDKMGYKPKKYYYHDEIYW